MSESSDGIAYVASLPDMGGLPQHSSPALSELSEKDKPWDKHRKHADTVARYYGESEFQSHAEAINFCAQLLEFRLSPNAYEGAYKLKLASARFCRKRHCPVCQWRRSLRWKAKAHQAIPKVIEAYPKHRWLFITLTLKNCPVGELRDTLHWVNASFKRLTRQKAWPVDGWIKSVEVTRGKDGSAHPHLHVLALVPPSYFGASYLSKAKWIELWEKCLKVDYKPILDVQAIKKDLAPHFIVPEILKYQCKESDLVADREWFLELTRQLKGTRAVAVGGVLQDYMRDLEQDPDDLIGKDEDDQGVDEGNLYFNWEKREKRYRMVDI
jgi:plasmid rolling circle replication initiator protein Rep